MANLYTRGDIVELGGPGFDIEILDPDGDVIAHLYHNGYGQSELTDVIRQELYDQAEQLLSHLNR